MEEKQTEHFCSKKAKKESIRLSAALPYRDLVMETDCLSLNQASRSQTSLGSEIRDIDVRNYTVVTVLVTNITNKKGKSYQEVGEQVRVHTRSRFRLFIRGTSRM